MLNDLSGILMRFRLHPVGMVADIEKAFLQLGLQVDQRDVTRFFWLKDIDNPSTDIKNIQEYRFARVPFGIVSSPFLLGATIEAHLALYDESVAQKVKDNIYVDNLVTSINTEYQAKELYLDAKQIFNKASMNLRDWTSNNADVSSSFDSVDKCEATTSKVLGHKWHLKSDTLTLQPIPQNQVDQHATKRLVLKRLASVFDPLGILSPLVLKGKVFLQSLWEKNLEWDDKLNKEDLQIWSNIEHNLDEISNCQIPRCIGIGNPDIVEYRLLCFCDASESAYAAVIYLHQTLNQESVTNVVFSKTRVAPVRKMSIPRLELLAVVIGMRCMDFVKQQLKLPIISSHLWTDSQAVIHWINSEKQLPVFVRNRVEEIKRNACVYISYVPTKENPADIASRGSTLEKLNGDSLWWNGPKWLSAHENQWVVFETPPNTVSNIEPDEVITGLIHPLPILNQDKAIDNNPFGIDSNEYSSLTKLLRVTAFMLRFIRSLQKRGVQNKHLTSEEIKDAEHMWLKHIQKKNFGEIFNSDPLQNKSNIARQLGVYVDVTGILRCKGRLENADICESARLPILLPKSDTYTRLVIDKVHKESLHSGVSQTLALVRQRFWIPHGRATVKSIVKSCGVCRRHEGGPYKLPPMCSLPKSRVTTSMPFARVGLDYLGPLFIKDSKVKEQRKVWICLFTCLVTRAIHLELVCDMSTSEFLMCFRRFISQRGTPSDIISDNAMQFRTASTVLDRVWNQIHHCDDVWSYVSNAGIRWVFNTELAPWMGGFYERLVGLVKRALRKTLGRRLLTLIQLQTLLKEIESVINSRPLVYVEDDINSQIPITPAHFLSLNPNTGIPQLETTDDDDYQPFESTMTKVLGLWKKGQKILDSFWKVWREDYLLSLRERTQTCIKEGRIQSNCEPKVNDVVLVKDACSRGQWKFGKITQLGQSRDNLIRSASVLIPTGKAIRRPVNLLYPLEVSRQDHMDQNYVKKVNTTIEDRPKRNAAIKATKRIRQILTKD